MIGQTPTGAPRYEAFAGARVTRAIVDIGSNTVRLVLYGGASRAPVVLFNEKVTARLGHEVGQTGRMADEAIDLAMRGLRRYFLLIEELDVPIVEVVATAAARDAENGPEFLAQVAALGTTPRLLSGEEEAELSALGVVGAFPGASGIVADLGGGSLELVEIGEEQCTSGATMPLGTLRLPDHAHDTAKATKASIAQVIDSACPAFEQDQTLYLVGGTWRAMAVFAMNQRNYPLTDPHGYSVSEKEAREFACAIAETTPDDLRAIPRISTMRAHSLPLAATLLGVLLKRLKPRNVVFSSWGLREGLIYDRLPEHARNRDPLLTGITEFAVTRGCPVLLGTQVAAWTADAVPPNGRGSERLRLAATMLALASMQVEPNMRNLFGTEWAMHKRWLALSAAERGMLAMAIAANGNRCKPSDDMLALTDEGALETAICWGLATRLCRRLGGRSRATFEVSRLRVEDNQRLVLSIEESHADLYGLSSAKDMALLAERLGLEPVFRSVPTLVASSA